MGFIQVLKIHPDIRQRLQETEKGSWVAAMDLLGILGIQRQDQDPC